MGEEKLMAMVLISAIQDVKGVSQRYAKECLECHYEKHPSCFKGFKRRDEHFVYRINKSCTDFHTHQDCARAWIASDSTEKGDGEGWTFRNLVDHLSIEPSYLRRCLASETYDAYWSDEAKINSFLGFHSGVEAAPSGAEALGDTGCTDQGGESD